MFKRVGYVMMINISKIFLSVIIFSCFVNQTALSSQIDSSSLTTLETRLFNQTFSNEPVPERLNRIEKVIFGASSNETENIRIEKLSTFANNPQQTINTNRDDNSNSYPEDDSATDYPVVTQLEKNNFQKDYKNENIYLRLNRLENKVFGATFPQDSLFNRVEKLKTASNANDDNFNKSVDPVENSTMFANLNSLELAVLNQTYDNDPVSRRLSRLENKMFGSAQGGSTESRLAKLNQNIENTFSYNIPRNIYPTSIGGMSEDYSSTTTVAPSAKSALWSIARSILYSFLTGNSYSNYGGYDPYYPYSYNRSSNTNFGTGAHILP